MKQYKINFTPDALIGVENIYTYIVGKSRLPEVALSYVQTLQQKSTDLNVFPERGIQRDDIYKNLRMTPLDKNAIAAFKINEKEQTVIIINIFLWWAGL